MIFKSQVIPFSHWKKPYTLGKNPTKASSSTVGKESIANLADFPCIYVLILVGKKVLLVWYDQELMLANVSKTYD